MQKIRKEIGKVLKDLAVPVSKKRIPKKHALPNNTIRSSGNVIKTKKVAGKSHRTGTCSLDNPKPTQQRNVEKNSNIAWEQKGENQTVINAVVDVLATDDVSINDSGVDDFESLKENNEFTKQQIVLDWPDYCKEREKLSSWLVPWEDNPSTGRYTLIIQSNYSTTKIIRETMPTRSDFPINYFEDSTLMLSKEEYIEELNLLLMFMTSWDRQAIVNRYKVMLWATDNEFDIMKALGTPQKLAVMLAKDYEPTAYVPKEQEHVEKQESKIRSVATSNHSNTEENQLDSDLTMSIDMSDNEASGMEDSTTQEFCQKDTDDGLNEERKLSACKEQQWVIKEEDDYDNKKLLPKTVPVFLLLSTIVSIVTICFTLIIVTLLTVIGGAIICIPIETLISYGTTFTMKDIVAMIGIILIMLGIGEGILLSAVLFCKRILRKLISWITRGIKRRHVKKLEAEANEETE